VPVWSFTFMDIAIKLDSDSADFYDRNAGNDDHYSQPGTLFRKVMTDDERNNTIGNIVDSMNNITGTKREEIIQRQLTHFYKADKELAIKIAEGLAFSFIKE